MNKYGQIIPSSYGQRPRHFRSETKRRHQEEHLQRLQRWQNMPPELQMAELNARLGLNEGAKKQRARIQKLIGSIPAKAEV